MNNHKLKTGLRSVCGVVFGSLLTAVAVGVFIVPQGIITGGVTGLSILVSHYTPLDLAAAVLVINMLLLAIGTWVLGKEFLAKTILGSVLYPVFLSMVQTIPGITQITSDRLMSALYGGALLGIGVGIVVRVGASTGGTDVIALVLNKKFHLPVAMMLYVTDFLILSTQVMFSDMEQILYGILSIVLISVVMNHVMLLGKSQIQLFIVSEKFEEIRQRLLNEVDSGVTMVYIETGYGRENQKAVMCITQSRKLYDAMEQIQQIDPRAFVSITKMKEVRGRGFTLQKK